MVMSQKVKSESREGYMKKENRHAEGECGTEKRKACISTVIVVLIAVFC